jgi:hypothetical protein
MNTCPRCESNRTQRRSVAWREGLSVAEHPDSTQSQRVSTLSAIHSPPSPPASYLEQLVGATIFGSTAFAIAFASFKLLPFVFAAAVVGLSLLAGIQLASHLQMEWSLLVPSNHQRAVSHHAEAMSLYSKQWLCEPHRESRRPVGLSQTTLV